MPITLGDKDKDTLGDLLRQQSGEPGYDPQRWQDEANGHGKNRVLRHGSGNDVVEVVEPQPPVSRRLELLPADPQEAARTINGWGIENPELNTVEHGRAIGEEMLRIRREYPALDETQVFNEAVETVCKKKNISPMREQTVELHQAPTPEEIQRDDVKRLEAEQARLKNPPRNWATDSRSMDNASLRSMPAAKAKKGR